MQITGAILIGGRSRRMGTPKHQLSLRDGRTMLEHVLEPMQSVCSDVVIVDSTHGTHAGPHRVLLDHRPGLGPLGAIEALLASGIDDEYLICPCDLPLMSEAVLRLLLQGDDAHAMILRLNNRSE